MIENSIETNEIYCFPPNTIKEKHDPPPTLSPHYKSIITAVRKAVAISSINFILKNLKFLS